MKRVRVVASVVAVCASAWLSGCGGGGGGGGSCGKVEPCGGNITGHWNVSSSCLNRDAVQMNVAPFLAQFCAQATVTAAHVSTTGSLTFNADMTYTRNLMQTGSTDANVPMSCLMGLNCATATALIQVELAMNPVQDVQSITCTGTGDCVCTVVATPITVNETGTYQTSDTSVAMMSNGGTATQSYCVQDKTLHLVTVSTSADGGAPSTAIVGDVVAQKQ